MPSIVAYDDNYRELLLSPGSLLLTVLMASFMSAQADWEV